MTLTQLIDHLRTLQAKHGGDIPVWLGQASGPNLPLAVVHADAPGGVPKITLYPDAED